jgi:hypothetical protein
MLSIHGANKMNVTMILVKYHGPSNVKGARLSFTDLSHDRRYHDTPRQVFLSRDYGLSPGNQADDYFRRCGANIIAIGEQAQVGTIYAIERPFYLKREGEL